MQKKHTTGIFAALSSAIFLGLSPVFGKLAINFGFSPLAVVALRTSMAAALIFLIVVIFYRSFLYIFPVGLFGCILAGLINGLGSILYYMALTRLSASVGQMLYSLYPFFVAIWMVLDRQPPSRLTLIRIGIATAAMLLLTSLPSNSADPLGVAMMLGAAILYALHLPINQRVLYEVPAPTVTLYTLLSMSAVVVPAYLIFDTRWPTIIMPWWPVFGLTLVTSLSRLSLFLGIKRIGGMQTALLGLGELLVTILFSYIWLGEQLSWTQWLGAAGLGLSLLLVRFESPPPLPHSGKSGWLSWIRPPDIPRDIPWGPHE
ncbi:MAG: DMT family transporter [Chloroflexi bacterium]|nr:DMT family transporter [Chloroflexota bacterium]